MSVIKVIEFLTESSISWEDAVRQAVSKASSTVKNVKSLYIKEHSVKVEKGVITSYRINAIVNVQLN